MRVNAGLQARAFALWSGGVYQLAKLLAPDAESQTEAAMYASQVYRNLIFLEDITSGNVPGSTPALKAFHWQLMRHFVFGPFALADDDAGGAFNTGPGFGTLRPTIR